MFCVLILSENLKFNSIEESPTVFVVSPLLLPYVDNALAISLVGQSEFSWNSFIGLHGIIYQVLIRKKSSN